MLWPLFLFVLCIGLTWLACMALFPTRKDPPPGRMRDLETAPPPRPDSDD